ncbi:hypothetical protein ABN056_08375 [Providencia vermicola]|uniref:hypothetical protein n=1 Tax=Providencia vermicola TaxID=333965 RepID=UPI0032DB58EA
MKKLFMFAALLVLAGCGDESKIVYTCEVNGTLNDLVRLSSGAKSFPEGTTLVEITLENNVMTIPSLGKDGYKSNIMKEVQSDDEVRHLKKGDLIYDSQDVTEVFLNSTNEVAIIHGGKWMQELSNCK